MDTLQLILVVAGVLIVAGVAWYLTRRQAPDLGEPAPPGQAPAPSRTITSPGIGNRLAKSSRSLGDALRGVFGHGALDQAFWDGMEEALIGADMGVAGATQVVTEVRASGPTDPDEARRSLRDHLIGALGEADRTLQLGDTKPAVVMVVGVNGAGKTTSIAKLASLLQSSGRTPLLGAADTFRAAADAQLRTWGERLGVDVVGGQEGADPAAVAYDALQAARSRGRDVVIVDTAGRLQSKHNLMAELGKIRRVLERDGDRIDEVLLVLDATGGQNAVNQVKEFAETVGVSGIILAKLDGTARGGVVVAVERQLGVPVKYIGVGEGVNDLIPFDPAEFVDALLADA